MVNKYRTKKLIWMGRDGFQFLNLHPRKWARCRSDPVIVLFTYKGIQYISNLLKSFSFSLVSNQKFIQEKEIYMLEQWDFSSFTVHSLLALLKKLTFSHRCFLIGFVKILLSAVPICELFNNELLKERKRITEALFDQLASRLCLCIVCRRTV